MVSRLEFIDALAVKGTSEVFMIETPLCVLAIEASLIIDIIDRLSRRAGLCLSAHHHFFIHYKNHSSIFRG